MLETGRSTKTLQSTLPHVCLHICLFLDIGWYQTCLSQTLAKLEESLVYAQEEQRRRQWRPKMWWENYRDNVAKEVAQREAVLRRNNNPSQQLRSWKKYREAVQKELQQQRSKIGAQLDMSSKGKKRVS